ncbi:MAG TPA: Smr/MutS family protein [Chitinophagaceae bacterium]|nr:Smr/MutS family protein [Chitinophagaceae bacterium]
MKFQVGDKVLVLHSNEEGEVVDVINDKMVMVEVRGVKFPAYIDQLDFPYFKRFTEQKLFSQKKKPKQYIDDVRKEKETGFRQAVSDGVWILFLPEFDMDEFGDDVITNLKVHLVNNTSHGYQFEYHLYFFGKSSFDLTNQVYAFKDFYLHDVPFGDLSDNPVFSFDFSLISPDKTKAAHYEASVKIKPKQLFNKIEELKRKGEATFSYQLFKDYPDRLPEAEIPVTPPPADGYKVYDAKEARQHLEPARHELDLHIERLTPDWQHLSALEKLALQLQTFEKYLDLAIAHHLPSMIIIHGVGTGRLRDEVHEALRYKREVKTFVNQYDPRFGYGATEVFFQY